MPPLIDLTGQSFGRLLVLSLEKRNGTNTTWNCECVCGNKKVILGRLLRNGGTKSCGCLSIEDKKTRHITHGQSKTRLYSVWAQMIKRCHNEKYFQYYLYGGRDIKVHPQWKEDFKSFYEWSMENGYEEHLTIDRIEVNDNYNPSNCRWVTMKTQQNNRRNNIVVEINGELMTIAELSEKTNINSKVLYARYGKGWRGEKLIQPLQS